MPTGMAAWLLLNFFKCLHNQFIEWLLLSASFAAKFGLVFVLTLENAFS